MPCYTLHQVHIAEACAFLTGLPAGAVLLYLWLCWRMGPGGHRG